MLMRTFTCLSGDGGLASTTRAGKKGDSSHGEEAFKKGRGGEDPFSSQLVN